MRNRIWATTLVLSLASTIHAQGVDARRVDKVMLDAMKAWRIPGAAVAIVRDDKVVYLNAYGVKESGGTEPVTVDTMFQIASTTKAFTTTALAMLVDEKKVSWDDPVRKHLEYFRLGDPCADSLVTVRDIVAHRTGLSRHDVLWDYLPLSRGDLLRRVQSLPLSKSFRSTYQYQNIMFVTAGEVVGAAAGVPWEDFVRTRLFLPLGMTRTTTSVQEWEGGDHARGHQYDRATESVRIQEGLPYEVLGPAGTIKSTARDLAQWVRFQLSDGMFEGKRLISADALAETKMPQTVIRLEKFTKDANPESNLEAYGLGWVIQDYRGELLVSHAGALNGFRTHVDLLPKKKSGFAVMINIGRSSATTALRNALTDLLLAAPARDWNSYYLALEQKSADEEAKQKAEREAKRHRDTKPSRDLSAYAGTYENAGYGPIRVAHENDRLVLQWGRLTVPLTHFHFDTFNAVDDSEDIDEMVVFQLGSDADIRAFRFLDMEFARKK